MTQKRAKKGLQFRRKRCKVQIENDRKRNVGYERTDCRKESERRSLHRPVLEENMAVSLDFEALMEEEEQISKIAEHVNENLNIHFLDRGADIASVRKIKQQKRYQRKVVYYQA